MSTKLPFEEAFERQMNNLPSPDGDKDWQKMMKLLDERDRGKRFVFFKNYGVWGTLFLLLLTGCYIFIWPGVDFREKAGISFRVRSGQPKDSSQQSIKAAGKTPTSIQVTPGKLAARVDDKHTQNEALEFKKSFSKRILIQQDIKRPMEESKTAGVQTLLKKDSGRHETFNTQEQATVAKSSVAQTLLNKISDKEEKTNDKELTAAIKVKGLDRRTNGVPVDIYATKADKVQEPLQNQTLIDITGRQAPEFDIKTGERNDITNLKDSAKNVTSKKAGKYFVSTGLGVQQKIPVGGQQSIQYGYNGNKNILSDHIPSVFLRLEREGKWFLQGEFIYRAPQLVRTFAYNRQTRIDTSSLITTTTLRLKKTFYSEIPLSFNYYLQPNWSAGLGGTYSWLQGAIAEKEINTRNTQTQANSVIKNIVPIAGYTDSFLYKSHVYLMLQTDYNWRRFSLGLRFAKDLQPYIKYTLPDGNILDQKNWSVEFILRMRLWKSAKF